MVDQSDSATFQQNPDSLRFSPPFGRGRHLLNRNLDNPMDKISNPLSARAVLGEALTEGIALRPTVSEFVNYALRFSGVVRVGEMLSELLDLARMLQDAGIASPAGAELVRKPAMARHIAALNMTANEPEAVGKLLGDLADFVDANRQFISVSITRPEEPKPLRVEVVGLPERQFVQTVERDQRDEIVRTVTTETDA